MPYTLTSPLSTDIPVLTKVPLTEARVVRFSAFFPASSANQNAAQRRYIEIEWTLGLSNAGNYEAKVTSVDQITNPAEVAAFLAKPAAADGSVFKQVEKAAFEWLVSKGKLPAGVVG